MPDDARELQTIRPASHTTALGELFIADVGAVVQQKVCEAWKLTSLIRPGEEFGRAAGLGALERTGKVPVPTGTSFASTILREFQDYEFGGIFAYVGYGVE